VKSLWMQMMKAAGVVLLFVGALHVKPFSVFLFYQPEVPQELQK